MRNERKIVGAVINKLHIHGICGDAEKKTKKKLKQQRIYLPRRYNINPVATHNTTQLTAKV